MFKENPKSELITYISQMKESEQENLLTVLKAAGKTQRKAASKITGNRKKTQLLSPYILKWYKSLPKFNTVSARKELIYEAIEEKRAARG
jgi:hypothetical protein